MANDQGYFAADLDRSVVVLEIYPRHIEHFPLLESVLCLQILLLTFSESDAMVVEVIPGRNAFA